MKVTKRGAILPSVRWLFSFPREADRYIEFEIGFHTMHLFKKPFSFSYSLIPGKPTTFHTLKLTCLGFILERKEVKTDK